jgi:hypothetical protein
MYNDERILYPEKFKYKSKRGDKPKNKYASKWYKVPNVEY